MLWFFLLLIPGLMFLYVWAKLPSHPPFQERTLKDQRNLRNAALFLAVVCIVIAIANLVL